MILEQYYLSCLAQASYLIADESTGTAIVVDPRRDVDIYFAEAERLGVEIRHVFLTHFHADFLAGHLEIAARTDAPIHVGRQGKTEYDAVALKEGDRFVWGDLALEVLETPGHTPEGCSYLIYDLARDPEAPQAVLTGDTLFIGDVGRPDLMASVGMTAEELAGMLYDSLHEKLMKLPDATLLYPGHGAGSMCGKNLSSETVSTIGDQRRFNYALQPMTKEAFVEQVAAAQPCAPRYFARDAMLNRQERGTLDAMMARLETFDLPEAQRLATAGEVVILDVREAEAWAAGHLPGSLNAGLEGMFATWAGSVLESEEAVIVLAPEGREREAALRLGRIGHDHVRGWITDGPAALAAHPELVRSSPRESAAEVAERGDEVRILDVRNPGEWDQAHAAGALHIPLGQLRDRTDELSRDTTWALMCRSGYRSSVATSILRRAGFERLIDQRGGFLAWEEAELPLA